MQVDEVTLPSVAVRMVQPSVGGEPGHRAPLLDDLRAHAPREIVGEALALVREFALIYLQNMCLTLLN